MNEEQLQAFDMATNANNGEMAIVGAAGVGKTFTLNRIISYFDAHGISFVVGAFTHQAVSNIEFGTADTLASILGIGLQVNTSSKNKHTVEKFVQKKEARKADVIIVDEFSMVDEFYVDIIRKSYDNIIWVGDDRQLSPVKGNMIDISMVPKIELTQPMRQGKESALYSACSILREGGKLQDIIPKVDKKTIFKYKTKEEALSNFRQGDVFIAYTNLEVNKLASMIMDRATFVAGDIVRVNKSFYLKETAPGSGDGEYLVKNGEVLTVESVRKLHNTFNKSFIDDHLYVVKFKEVGEHDRHPCYFTVFTGSAKEFESINQRMFKYIADLNKTSPHGYTAKQAVDEGKHPYISQYEWKAFFRDIFFPIRDEVIHMSHRSSSTVHKMQGSQSDKVFIMADGFKDHRLLYTAVTRAKKELHIVTGY